MPRAMRSARSASTDATRAQTRRAEEDSATCYHCGQPLSVGLAFVIGAAFWWSVGSGQFDDLEGPSHRILQDNDDAPP